jgi:16S rRNA (cytidine1402-2'-O)-methyltransferase
MTSDEFSKPTSKPVLLLLPNLLGDHHNHESFLPKSVDKAVSSLDGLIAESERSGRRYLGRFSTKKPPQEMPIAVFNESTPEHDIDFFLEPIRKGERWGYVSDSGLPCIADPGAKLVRRASHSGIIVQAFIGPSSLLLALMLSGLSGQRFAFHGYIDRNPVEQVKRLEKQSYKATQIFMETPYRNQQTLQMLLDNLQENTWLCIAADLTLPSQMVISQTIGTWKKSPLPNLQKRNALFLIYTDF